LNPSSGPLCPGGDCGGQVGSKLAEGGETDVAIGTDPACGRKGGKKFSGQKKSHCSKNAELEPFRPCGATSNRGGGGGRQVHCSRQIISEGKLAEHAIRAGYF